MFALWFCFLLVQVGAENRSYRPEDIPMVHLKDRTRYVSNPDGVLGNEAVAEMDRILFQLEQETGVQTLVVAVNRIEEGDCFNFAYELGRKNGVGQKGKDNGLVILLVTEERCIQFVTGYGLEGDLPDAICKQIQMRYMNEHLGNGDWDRGMLAGIKALKGQLDGTGEPLTSPEGESDNSLLFMIPFCFFVVVPFILWLKIRQQKKCPKCHKHTLQPLSERTLSNVNGIRTKEVVLCCSNCGHIVRRQRKENDDNSSHHRGGNGGPFVGGPFMGGGFGSGHSGGGFSGGSFGGGDFGGGGAGSKF